MQVTVILDCWRGLADAKRLQQALDQIGPWQLGAYEASTGDPAYAWLAQRLLAADARTLPALMTDDQSGRFSYEATPCHWQVSRDDVVVSPAAAPSLADSEALVETANDALDGAARIELLSAALWSVRARFDLDCGSLIQCAGQSLQAALPANDASRAFKRVLNNVQMAWYQHPVNEAREKRGLLPINAFWLVGGRARRPVLPMPFDGVLDTGLRAELLAQTCTLPLQAQASGKHMLAWLTEGRDARAHDAPLPNTAYEKLTALLGSLPKAASVELLVTDHAGIAHATRKVAGNPVSRWLAGFKDVDALSQRLLQ
ncbi:MAG: hypothetical protein ACRCV9_20975 [Burkholderiaceae bacterium]